jgi:hypothetical protein
MKSDITYRNGSLSSTDRIASRQRWPTWRRTGAKPLTLVANPGDLALRALSLGRDLAQGGGRLASEAARSALRGQRPSPPDEWAVHTARILPACV